MASARAGTGCSAAVDPVLAAGEATIAARAHLDAVRPGRGADLAFVFIGDELGAGREAIVSTVLEASGARIAFGCTACRAFTDTGGTEGVAVMLTRGTAAEVAVVRDLARDPAGAGRGIARTFARQADLLGGGDQVLLLLVDPRHFRARTFLDALAEDLPPGTPVLGGASAVVRGAVGQFPEPIPRGGPRGGVADDTAIGLVLRGAHAAIGLTQAGQPIAGPFQVGTVEGHLLLGLDGRPALSVFADLLPTWLVEDLPRLGRDVLLARPLGGPGARTHFHYMPIAGVEPARGGILVSGAPVPGESLWLAVRDPGRARRDLRDMLTDLRRRSRADAGFGLYVEDTDRGPRLHEAEDVDATLITDVFGDLPWVGWRSPFAITTLEGRPCTVGHGAALSLFW